MWGWICFSNDKKFLGERLVPVDQPMPAVTELPDTGFPWKAQWAVNLNCLNGIEAGTGVILKANTVGGIQAIAGILEAVRDRLNGGQHDGKLSPIVLLGEGFLPAPAARSHWDTGTADHRLDADRRSGTGAQAGVTTAIPADACVGGACR
jgi:hypothetical protein